MFRSNREFSGKFSWTPVIMHSLPVARTGLLNIKTLIRVYSQNSNDLILQSGSDKLERNECQPIVIKQILYLFGYYLVPSLRFSLTYNVPDPPNQKSSTLRCCSGQRNWTHTTVSLTVCQIANTHPNLPAPHPARCPGLLPSVLFVITLSYYNKSKHVVCGVCFVLEKLERVVVFYFPL